MLLPVPQEEADAVKSTWKLRSKLNVVEYGLDLDTDFKSVLKEFNIKVGDKVYKAK